MDDEKEQLTFSEWWNDYLDEMREYGLTEVADRDGAYRQFNRGYTPKEAASADARFCATGEY